jgi:hypothetical protein
MFVTAERTTRYQLATNALPKAVSRLTLFVVVGSCLLLCGCSSFFVGFVSNPGGATTVSGTVTVVSLGIFHDPSGTTTFTAVTFINFGNAVTINFCGDQRNLFPVNDDVQVDFNTGFNCSVLVRVVIIAVNWVGDSKRLAADNKPVRSLPWREVAVSFDSYTPAGSAAELRD